MHDKAPLDLNQNLSDH